MKISAPDTQTVLKFLKTQGFKKLTARFEVQNNNFDGTAELQNTDQSETEKSYELIQEKDLLEKWLEEITKIGIVAFDTETDSLDATQATLIGISLATKNGKACYVPLRHNTSNQSSLLTDGASAIQQIPFDEAIALVKPMLEDPSILKIGHNIKYDALVVQQTKNGSIRLKSVDDTMCLSYVLEGGLHGHGLDELSELHFDHTNIKYKDVCGSGKSQISFAEVDVEKALDYAAEDADMTFRLHKKLKGMLARNKMTTVYELSLIHI